MRPPVHAAVICCEGVTLNRGSSFTGIDSLKDFDILLLKMFTARTYYAVFQKLHEFKQYRNNRRVHHLTRESPGKF